MNLHQTTLCMQSLLIIIMILAAVYGMEEKLLFSTFSALQEVDLDTGVVRTLTSQKEYVYSMAYNHKKRYMYVPRYTTGDIVRFPYPNNHTVMFETVVHTIKPVGIAFDSVNNHVYWTEHSHGKIMRCNADGSNVTIILNETEPSAITLDVHNRWIYYGQKLSGSKIFRANFDGKNKTVIIKNLPSFVYGIEVDVSVERLYWMEYQTGDLRSAFFNGSDVRTILSTNATNMNWDIDTDEDFIFYTSNKRIMKINKSLGQNPDVVHTDTEQIDGILLYKQDGKDCGENELMFSSPTWKKNKKGCEYGVN